MGCDYANARIAGMRGRLLGERGLLDLLAQPDLAARVESLRKSPAYGEALASLAGGPADPLRATERGLRARLAGERLRIDGFLRGQRARSLFRAVLAFEDGWTLKTVLRGIARGQGTDRILALVAPTAAFDEPALEQLARIEDAKGVLDLLSTWRSPYALPLAEAFPAYLPGRDLLVLEVALDRFLFARALATAGRDGEDGRILLGFLQAQIDLANAGLLLKLGGGAPGQEFFIPGGRALDARRFRRLSGLDLPALREALPREPELHGGARLRSAAEGGDPFAVDQALHDLLRAALRRLALVQPLSLAVPLSFLLELGAEVRKIRLVLRGAELGLPADELIAAVEA